MSNQTDQSAVQALSALAHEHRLAVFRLLVQAGPEGKPAGVIAEALGLPSSSMSFHLAHLQRAGLIEQKRDGRLLIYSAVYPAMNDLVSYLTENCCGGAPCGEDSNCEPQPQTTRSTL